jgi:hypothetical protein
VEIVEESVYLLVLHKRVIAGALRLKVPLQWPVMQELSPLVLDEATWVVLYVSVLDKALGQVLAAPWK